MCDGKWGVEGRLRQDCGRLKHLFQPRFFPSFLPTNQKPKKENKGRLKHLFQLRFFPSFLPTKNQKKRIKEG